MHEISIAQAVLDLARQSAPQGAVVRSVAMDAGPVRGIVPEAMQWAWQAVTQGSDFEQVSLELHILPWELRCTSCDRKFTADEVFAPCACGCEVTTPVGGDQLRLLSLEVDDTPLEQPQVAQEQLP